MLKKEAIQKLLEFIKIPAEDITRLMAEGTEEDLALPDLKVYTNDEYNTLITNTKDSVKSGYYRGGQEVLLKQLKEKFELDVDGKDAEKILEAYAAKKIAEAGIDPGKAKKEWEEEKVKLQEKVLTLEKEKKAIEQEKATIARDTEWLQKFPAGRIDTIADQDKLTLLKTKLSVGEDGVLLYKGQPLKDELQNNMPIDKAIEHVFSQEKWIAEQTPAPQGRGGSSSVVTTGKPTKKSEVVAQWEKDGKTPSGSEFQAHLVSLVKQDPTFDLSN